MSEIQKIRDKIAEYNSYTEGAKVWAMSRRDAIMTHAIVFTGGIVVGSMFF